MDAAGRKEASEFWLDGELVGEVWWDEGRPGIAVGRRGGKKYGYLVEYHEGTVSYAEPFVDGLQHGWAKQYTRKGRLLIANPYVRGTGTDYFCNSRGELQEEHPIVDRRLSGFDRWWTDRTSVHEETHYVAGEKHGIVRHWSGGKLSPEYPKYFVNGEEVSRERYLEAARRDPTLPAHRPEDDSPERTLPERFLELRRRALKRSRAR